MNMINRIFGLAEKLVNLFALWLSFNAEEWAWCLVKVDNRIDRY